MAQQQTKTCPKMIKHTHLLASVRVADLSVVTWLSNSLKALHFHNVICRVIV